jgi:hypothetical protein
MLTTLHANDKLFPNRLSLNDRIKIDSKYYFATVGEFSLTYNEFIDKHIIQLDKEINLFFPILDKAEIISYAESTWVL